MKVAMSNDKLKHVPDGQAWEGSNIYQRSREALMPGLSNP
jgi:hypothetical protein